MVAIFVSGSVCLTPPSSFLRSPIVRHRKRLYTNDSLSSRHGSTRSLHRSVTALSPEKEKCLANGKLKTEQEKDELIKAEKAETGSVSRQGLE